MGQLGQRGREIQSILHHHLPILEHHIVGGCSQHFGGQLQDPALGILGSRFHRVAHRKADGAPPASHRVGRRIGVPPTDAHGLIGDSQDLRGDLCHRGVSARDIHHPVEQVDASILVDG